MHQSGARHEQRPFHRKLSKVKRRNRPTGGAEKHQIAAGAQYVEVLIERGLPHAVVNHLNSLAAREALGLSLEILSGVEDYVVRAGFTREFGFLLGADR